MKSATEESFFSVLKTRRSCRAFTPEPVSEALIRRVAEAGSWAASGRGMQSPTVLAVTNPEWREMLCRINAEILGSPDADPFYGAPCILVTVGDKTRNTVVEDGALCLGNMMLEAEALGLASCWIHRARETFERPEAQELLRTCGLDPEQTVGIGNLALGYAATAPAPAKPRKPDFLHLLP